MTSQDDHIKQDQDGPKNVARDRFACQTINDCSIKYKIESGTETVKESTPAQKISQVQQSKECC